MIPGHDVDISVLANRGEIVAFTIQRDEAPDKKCFVVDERLRAAAAEIVRATQFHGLAHFDMRVDADSGAVYAIECNPRVWGSLPFSVWAGVNFIQLGCQLALGGRPNVTPVPTGQVWHQGVAPRRMLRALLQGRTAPADMTGATLASWRQAHADPLPQLLGQLTEASEEWLRQRLEPLPGQLDAALLRPS
jgi:predicted ATP-grasp superfamily ATP-dependent carboligase